MKTFDLLDLTSPGAVLGQHSIWFPELAVKVPFQFGGRITKLSRHETRYELRDTFPHELAILRALAAEQMAPPIGDVVYFKEVVSTYRGAWRSDPCGAYGFEMADAVKLPAGHFTLEQMRRLPIEGSPGAWGDIAKMGNVVNGYLIDVRRTAWDMLRWRGELPEVPEYEEDLEALEARVREKCSFPKGERPEPYQDCFIGYEVIHGSRQVGERAELLSFHPRRGDSVVDIGCQAGGMLQWSHFSQRLQSSGEEIGEHIGIEIDPDYLSCAKDLARSCRMNLNLRQMDVTTNTDKAIEWIRSLCPSGPDHLLLLSMEKHLGEDVLWKLVDGIGAKCTYLETNAMKTEQFRLRGDVERRGGRYVGDSNDRNLRRLYSICPTTRT